MYSFKTSGFRGKLLSLASLSVMFLLRHSVQADPGTAFTYQGYLDDAGVPIEGTISLRFSVFEDEAVTSQLGSPLTFLDATANKGLINAELDFGTGVFDGTSRWLQIEVDADGTVNGDVFAAIGVVQILPIPYAIYAETAGSAVSVENDAVNDADADSTNEIQNLSSVLSTGNNAGSTEIDNLGSIGIGTAPSYPLHLNAAGTSTDSFTGATAAQQAKIQVFVNQTDETGGGIAVSNEGGFFDLNDGYITYLPLSGGQGIRVQGELKVVDLAWPDYVFEDGYEMKSLSEIEKHIQEKGHLPGVPSAAEIAKDGADLGQMNVILLEKIEEMTLHMIEMKKEIDALKAAKGDDQ